MNGIKLINSELSFVDRAEKYNEELLDVIIPLYHVNRFFQNNLKSYFKEIPINRLIIGNAGADDGVLDVLKEFPRVEVLDHRHYKSLGFSLRDLVEKTQTRKFIYLHADVYLPDNWFDVIKTESSDFDWFECDQTIAVECEYLFKSSDSMRAYSGSQIGCSEIMKKVVSEIDDDFLYRNEDIIIQNLLLKCGGKYGKTPKTTHIHQLTNKGGVHSRRITNVQVDFEVSSAEKERSNHTYSYGIIKYLKPEDCSPDVIESVNLAIAGLIDESNITADQIRDFIMKYNDAWIPFLTALTSDLQKWKQKSLLRKFCTVYGAYGFSYTLKQGVRKIFRIINSCKTRNA